MSVIRECPSCGQKNRVPSKFLASTGKCGACKAALPPPAEPIAVDGPAFDEIVLGHDNILPAGAVRISEP